MTHLTFPSDRLAALAAVATSIRQATGFHYIAGNWVELFPMCLFWYQCSNNSKLKRSAPRKRFPSWSWTSFDFAGTDGFSHYSLTSFQDMKRATVLGWDVTELKGRTAVLGEVESAQLRISSVVTRIISWSITEEQGKIAASFKFENNNLRSEKVELQEGIGSDVSLSFISPSHYGYISDGDDHTIETGLLLAPYKDGYVRVGSMSVRVLYGPTGDYKPLWNEEEIQHIYLY